MFWAILSQTHLVTLFTTYVLFVRFVPIIILYLALLFVDFSGSILQDSHESGRYDGQALCSIGVTVTNSEAFQVAVNWVFIMHTYIHTCHDIYLHTYMSRHLLTYIHVTTFTYIHTCHDIYLHTYIHVTTLLTYIHTTWGWFVKGGRLVSYKKYFTKVFTF
jgi:hypothetical protein